MRRSIIFRVLSREFVNTFDAPGWKVLKKLAENNSRYRFVVTRSHGYGCDLTCMHSRHLLDSIPGPCIPQPQAIIQMPTHDSVTIHIHKRQIIAAWKCKYSTHAVSSLKIPQLKSAIVAARYYAFGVVGEFASKHFSNVARQRMPDTTSGKIPDARRIVCRSSEDHIIRWTKRHWGDCLQSSTQYHARVSYQLYMLVNLCFPCYIVSCTYRFLHQTTWSSCRFHL